MMAIHYSNEYDYMSKETSRVWNRVRVLNGGDTIRVWRMDAAEEDRRCTSSVSYMVSIDRNRRHPARRVELEDHICYGELLNLIAIGLPHHPRSSGTPVTLAFVHIKPAVSHKHRIGSHEWSYYKEYQAEEIVDMVSVDQLVGRVQSMQIQYHLCLTKETVPLILPWLRLLSMTTPVSWDHIASFVLHYWNTQFMIITTTGGDMLIAISAGAHLIADRLWYKIIDWTKGDCALL
ncbi:hypothetical protein C365_03414 [Cryptococcus neoformans Bt85]|nr:hypothetical protein C365_03414 [Cryptococcus neoformans var. grubii Bt85]